MQTVFIVTQGCYSDYHIERVFTNKKAAKKYVEYLKSYEDDYFIESIDIKEYELNEDYDKDKLSDRGYLVFLWKRGVRILKMQEKKGVMGSVLLLVNMSDVKMCVMSLRYKK